MMYIFLYHPNIIFKISQSFFDLGESLKTIFFSPLILKLKGHKMAFPESESYLQKAGSKVSIYFSDDYNTILLYMLCIIIQFYFAYLRKCL